MIWLWTPVVNAIVGSSIEVRDGVREPVIVVLVGVGLDTCKGNVWVACGHGPDNFSDTSSVVEIHGFCEC